MIAGEFGKRLVLATDFDLRGAVSLVVELTRPGGEVEELPGVLGVGDLEVVDSRGVKHCLVDGEWMYRDWQDGDLDVPGRYRVRAVYRDAVKELRSLREVFVVRP